LTLNVFVEHCATIGYQIGTDYLSD